MKSASLLFDAAWKVLDALFTVQFDTPGAKAKLTACCEELRRHGLKSTFLFGSEVSGLVQEICFRPIQAASVEEQRKLHQEFIGRTYLGFQPYLDLTNRQPWYEQLEESMSKRIEESEKRLAARYTAG